MAISNIFLEIGSPDEMFASDDASWTTGAILTVDGGESIK